MSSVILPGTRFGKLTAEAPTDQRTKWGVVLWRCHCDCGQTHLAASTLLRRGAVKSCGCLAKTTSVKPGQCYGKLTVISQTSDRNRFGARLWQCRCDCGNQRRYPTGAITRNKSCGQCRTKPIADITNQTFGRLTALRPTDARDDGHVVWLCQCACGNTTHRSAKNLKSGGSRQHCGCQTSQIAKQVFAQNMHFVDGTQINRISDMSPPNTNTSGVRGVRMDRKTGKYRAYIHLRGKQINLGCFATLNDAAIARRQAEQNLFAPLVEKFLQRQAESPQ